jgi:hypothetical protein
MSIVHTFVSAKADGPDTTLVRPTDWNATHSLTGLRRHYITAAGTTGYTIYHNLGSTFSALVGYSTTWNTEVWVNRVGLTNMNVSFSNPSATTSDIFISNVEIIS